MKEGGLAQIVRTGMPKNVQHAPEEDVAREVVRLRERIVSGRLSGRDQAEGRALREKCGYYLRAAARVAVAERCVAGDAGVVG